MLGWLLLAVGAGSAAEIRVAVAPFDDGSGQGPAGLGVGLQSMITTDLAQAEAVDVVERARLQDLLAEMELGAKGVLDPATAAKVGKVAGATHVVTGTYAVVGGTMRIDARLAEVETGKVAGAAEASGEKDAFFELQKEVVTELLAALGAQLTAKERAAIGRVHTADFGAFEQYSRAVSLYDADRYAEAVALLEQVSAKDEEFKLAKVTLADILAVRDQAADRARAASIATAEARFATRRADAAWEAEQLAQLRAIARDPARDWRDRVTADLLVVVGLAVGTHGGFHALEDESDPFLLERTGELAFQAAWAELEPRIPSWFPDVQHPSPWFDRERGWDVARVHGDAREDWFDGDNHNLLLSTCTRATRLDEEVERLWLPRAARLDAHRRVLDRASRECFQGKPWREMDSAWLELAEQYRRIGRLAPSTEILRALAGRSTDEGTLQRVKLQAERNAERQAELDAFPVGTREHELYAHRAEGSPPRADGLKKDPNAIRHPLNWMVRRNFPINRPFFLGGVPAWPVTRPDWELVSGPRTGTDESLSLRFYRDLRPQGPYRVQAGEPEVWVLGGVPRGEVTARVTVDFTPAEDWWPLQFPTVEPGWAPLADRPVAGLLVGITEVETNPICDPADPSKMEPVPTRAIGALIAGGELQLARMVEAWPDPDACTRRPNALHALGVEEVLARKPLRKDRVELEVRVQGRVVTASAGGTSVRAELPEAPVGFPGLFADGLGYVELSSPALE